MYIYTQCMHTYIYITYMHIYIYIYIYIYICISRHIHTAWMQQHPMQYSPPQFIKHIHYIIYFHMHSITTTHTHTLLALIQACYTKPLSFLGITGHPPRQVGSVLAPHQHPSSMQAQTGVIAG